MGRIDRSTDRVVSFFQVNVKVVLCGSLALSSGDVDVQPAGKRTAKKIGLSPSRSHDDLSL